MKKVVNPLFTLLLIFLLCQCFAQEWQIIEHSDFSDSVFTSKADFSEAQFDSIATFSWVKFESKAKFVRAQFGSKADFSYARFDSIAHFSGVQFGSVANFVRAKFGSEAFFTDAQFDSKAYFWGVQFSSYAGFLAVQFNSSAIFRKAQFGSKADFMFTKFGAVADFMLAKFGSIAIFRMAQFGSVADFWWAQFDSLANFKYAQFGAEINFMEATLPKYLDLSGVSLIANQLDLTTTKINPNYDTCYINLTGAAIDKIRFRYKRFTLWFPEEDSIEYELKANVYEELLKKQMDEGFTQSYELLDKEYREFQYIDPDCDYGYVQGHLMNWIDKTWWGYGYDKELILRNVLVIYLVLSLFNTFMLKHLTENVYKAEKINEWRNETQDIKFGRLFKSIPFSMFYTAQIFFGVKFYTDRLQYKQNLQGWRIFNLLYFFFIYLGGLVCLAYLANYIITV